MFKPTPTLQRSLRRLPLTTKQARVGSGYYKGNRVGSMGHFKSRSPIFVPDRTKIRTYMCPDLSEFYLTPFVSNKVQKPKAEGKYKGYENGPINGQFFLEEWKAKNGQS